MVIVEENMFVQELFVAKISILIFNTIATFLINGIKLKTILNHQEWLSPIVAELFEILCKYSEKEKNGTQII